VECEVLTVYLQGVQCELLKDIKEILECEMYDRYWTGCRMLGTDRSRTEFTV